MLHTLTGVTTMLAVLFELVTPPHWHVMSAVPDCRPVSSPDEETVATVGTVLVHAVAVHDCVDASE